MHDIRRKANCFITLVNGNGIIYNTLFQTGKLFSTSSYV
jgi:hypothetical protein